MISRPPSSNRNPVGHFIAHALPGMVAGLVWLAGATILNDAAQTRLHIAQARAAAVRRAPVSATQDTAQVDQATSLVNAAIDSRNAVVSNLLRLEKLASTVPQGVRLVHYDATNGVITAEGERSELLGQTAANWASIHFVVSGPTTQRGSVNPGNAAAIEPNVTLTIATPTPSPNIGAPPARPSPSPGQIQKALNSLQGQ